MKQSSQRRWRVREGLAKSTKNAYAGAWKTLSSLWQVVGVQIPQNPFRGFVVFVAGTGIAPVPRDYEPLEVLLLHPAMGL